MAKFEQLARDLCAAASPAFGAFELRLIPELLDQGDWYTASDTALLAAGRAGLALPVSLLARVWDVLRDERTAAHYVEDISSSLGSIPATYDRGGTVFRLSAPEGSLRKVYHDNRFLGSIDVVPESLVGRVPLFTIELASGTGDAGLGAVDDWRRALDHLINRSMR